MSDLPMNEEGRPSEVAASNKSARSIARMIGLGFAGVLLLHLAVAVLSHVGLSSATERRQLMHQEQAILSAALGNDRDIAELQRDALSFMYTGSASLATQVGDDSDALAEELQRFSEMVSEDGYRSITVKMLAALTNYQSGFRKVIVDRDERDRLLNTSIRPFSEQMREELTLLMQNDRSTVENEHAHLAADALREFTECRANIDRYIASPNSVHARQFELAYSRLAPIFDELGRANTPMAQGLERWHDDVLRVINRTRSFLHLVNVVLSGEALEFRTLSASLTSNMLAVQDRVANETLAAQKRFTNASATFGVLTIIAGILAGLWIGRSVSAPIVSITKTFSRLARGEEAKIVGVERADEIGEMARAAEVFALRNRETRRLLTQATELGEIQSATNATLISHVKELRQKNEDLDSFCYSASHDLKSPLRSISLLASWIEEDEDNQLSDESSEFLETLQARSLRLQGLLGGLLEYSRVGRSENLSEEFDALDMAHETVDAISEGTTAKLEVKGVNSRMFAPQIAVQKCVQNLIDNSIKHHDRLDPNITVEVQRKEDGFTTITVHDDGPGIPPVLHHKILEIFQTVKRRDEHETSGIGLAIVQRLVDNHAAALTIDSDGIRGCSISIQWPNGVFVSESGTDAAPQSLTMKPVAPNPPPAYSGADLPVSAP